MTAVGAASPIAHGQEITTTEILIVFI